MTAGAGNAEIVRFRHNSVEDLDKRSALPKEPASWCT